MDENLDFSSYNDKEILMGGSLYETLLYIGFAAFFVA